jgi:hypothetical protein
VGKPFFVAAGHHGLLLTSPDGKSWSAPQVGKDGETYRSAAGGNGRLVATGSYGSSFIAAASTDGAAWKAAPKDDRLNRALLGIAFGDGTFVGLGGDPGGVGFAQPFVVLSRDGLTWDSPHKIPGQFVLRRAAFGNGRWVGVGDRGRRSASEDGKVWKDAAEVKAIDTLVDVACGNGVFVGVGLHGLRMRTEDGLKWSDRQTGEEGEHLNSVVWAGDRFVAIGAGATYTSKDGAAWERLPNQDSPVSATYGNGIFVGVRWRGKVFRSSDAVKWEAVHTADHHLEAIAFGEAG